MLFPQDRICFARARFARFRSDNLGEVCVAALVMLDTLQLSPSSVSTQNGSMQGG